jgi:hypothetical protein
MVDNPAPSFESCPLCPRCLNGWPAWSVAPIRAPLHGYAMDKLTDYARFEALKRAWVGANPEATAAQYDAAMQHFANLCGV